MIKICLGICFIFFATACSKEDEITKDGSGTIIKLPHLWGTSLSDNGQLSEVVTEAQFVYNQSYVVLGANQNGKRTLASIDSQTGKIAWMWSDLLGLLSNPNYLDPISIEEDEYYIFQNKFLFQLGSSTYCIDLSKGETLWKHKVDLARLDRCSGWKNLYFNSGSSSEAVEADALYSAEMDGDVFEKKFISPAYDFTEKDTSSPIRGLVWRILPFDQSGDVMLAILFGDPAKTGKRYPTNLGLYNYTQRKWIYERAPLNGSYPDSNVSWAKLYNGKVYHTSTRNMQCNDVLTGKLVWSVSFDQGFGSSGFIIQDGKIFGNNDNRYTYCLDPETGAQIWKEESSGSASPISYLNGVLYFMGGGDGRLHAIDANTGKHLWRLRSPDVDTNSGAFFYGTCVAVPGQGGNKGRVVATTGLNAYGYEAIR